jgi:HlyD family secretion protein
MMVSGPSERIFRQVAIERLSSPDQLDHLIVLASPIGWAALSAIAVLLTAIVVWAIFGEVPSRVQGNGILVARGGQVFDAMAPASGTLATVAAIGAEVQKGDVVATLDYAAEEQDLQHAQNVLMEHQHQLEQLVARFDREAEARRKVDAKQRENLGEIIRSAEQRRAFYEEAMKGDETAAVKGFITRRYVQETRQLMETAAQDGQRARNDLLRIDAEELDQAGRRDQEVWQQQQAVNAARRGVEEHRIKLARNTRIVSPIAGHVTEVKASVGTVVAAGRPVVSIETGGQELELVLFIPPEQGKKVAPGMEVRIEPSTVKKEEFGTLIGHVLDISEFPTSPEGMLAVLGNPELVKLFSAEGAPYAARVGLVADAASPSGYGWSNGKGPLLTLSAGTTAAAEVTVRTRAPITLVLPLLRRETGIGG